MRIIGGRHDVSAVRRATCMSDEAPGISWSHYGILGGFFILMGSVCLSPRRCEESAARFILCGPSRPGKECAILIELDEKKRIIQEFVPGKQVTLAHVIANPNEDLYAKLGLIDAAGAIGIFTITPSEAAMIAADVATKAANVSIGFVDRFNGSLVITGDVSAVQAALTEVMNILCVSMGFASAPITKT